MSVTSVFSLNPARRMILLVTGLLVMPFVVAFGLYWFEWRPAILGNHGELIQPPQALPKLGLMQPDGRPFPVSMLREKWTLVFVSQGPCDARCQQDLQQMRQVQVALNKEMGRLHRVLLSNSLAELAADPSLPELRKRYPDLLFAVPDTSKDGEIWRRSFGDAKHRFYVIDPLGNLIMRYPENLDMQGMRKDLERLLKYSWVG